MAGVLKLSNTTNNQPEIDLRKSYQIIIMIGLFAGLVGMIHDTFIYVDNNDHFLTILNITSIIIYVFVIIFKFYKKINLQSATVFLVLTMVVNILLSNIYSAYIDIPEWQFNFLRGTLIILVFVSISGLILKDVYLIAINIMYIITLIFIIRNSESNYVTDNYIFFILIMAAYSYAIFMFMKKLKEIIQENAVLQSAILIKNKEVYKKDKELIKEKAKRLEQTIEHKNRELLSNALILSQYIESREKLRNSLQILVEKTKPEDSKRLLNIISDLSVTENALNWLEFQKRFEDVHKDFYEKLLIAFPDLSPAEIKLAAFIKLGLSSKEIAALTNTSTGSIEVSRSRLRKKLNLNKSDNLTNFLFLFS